MKRLLLLLLLLTASAFADGIQPACGTLTTVDEIGHTPAYYDLSTFHYSTTLGGALTAGFPAAGTTFYFPHSADSPGRLYDCPVEVIAVANIVGGIGGTPDFDVDYAEKQPVNEDDSRIMLGASTGSPMLWDLSNDTQVCAYTNPKQLLSNGAGSNALSNVGAKQWQWLHSSKGAGWQMIGVGWGDFSGTNHVVQTFYDSANCWTVNSSKVRNNVNGGSPEYTYTTADFPASNGTWDQMTITYFDPGGGENGISEDGTHMAADFNCNGVQAGCNKNIRVFDIFAHTFSHSMDVPGMVSNVSGGTGDPTQWNADQCYIRSDITKLYCGGSLTGTTAASNYIYVWNASTGAFLYKVPTSSGAARGHITWKSDPTTGDMLVIGGGWGSTASGSVIGFTDLDSGTPDGALTVNNPTRTNLVDLSGGGDPTSGVLTTQNWFYWSYDGHGGGQTSITPGAAPYSPVHTLNARAVNDAGSAVATVADQGLAGGGTWGNGVKNVRTPTRLDQGQAGARNTLLADWATYYGQQQSGSNALPLNHILVCDLKATGGPKCWSIVPSYDQAVVSKDCALCENVTPTGKSLVFRSNLTDTSHIYFLRVKMNQNGAGFPTAQITAPNAGQQTGVVTFTGTCTAGAGHTCASGQLKRCTAAGTGCVNVGAAIATAGPYSRTDDTAALVPDLSSYAYKWTVTDEIAQSSDSSLLQIQGHNGISPQRGSRH